ncbi:MULTISPECIES: hypothetical protein [Thalassospira]|uniref:Uncharacterized protein n=2 Tax=Thalassospira TaxID=168934 RepID=A0A367W515_9PROT|nr:MULTISPECIES: hypothetical protein [Thalassospira]MDG4718388.1 hypothetical protein [Thalassospira sp. FZY0004]RCK34691.1 hypothetical protein TH19_15775 [Thalassospira profundimaris]
MIRRLFQTIAAFCVCLFLVFPHRADAQNKQSFQNFTSNLRIMHLGSLTFCDENRNIMPAQALAKATNDNDVFEMACIRALDGRYIGSSNWKFIHRAQDRAESSSNMLAMMKGFNLDGELFFMVIGHRKIKQSVGQPNERAFYVPIATMMREADSRMNVIFDFVNTDTMDWNTPSPQEPDFSIASKELGLDLNMVWRAMIKKQFAEGVLLIPATR